MKQEKTIAKYSVLVLLCGLAALVLILFPVFLSKEMDTQTQEFLSEISNKNAESIGFKFKEHNSIFNDLSNSIPCEYYDSPQKAIENIGEIRTELSYTCYGVAMRDGETYTSLGGKFCAFNTDLIEKALTTNDVTMKRISAKDSKDNQNYYVMIKSLGDYQTSNSTFFLLFSEENVKENIGSHAFQGSEIFFILDKEGNTIMSTFFDKNNKTVTENIFSESLYLEKYNGSRALQIKNNINQNKSGMLKPSKERNMYLYYAPLSFNDWYLFSIVPADTVNATRNTVLLYVFLLCFFLVIVFLLFALYVILSEKSKKRSLHELLYVDNLTKGSSYAKFCIDVRKALIKNKSNHAYIVMDLDSFKIINSKYGYDFGNKIIVFIYNCWTHMLKENEYVSRIGVDSFAVCLQYKNQDEIINRVESFCRKCMEYSLMAMSEYIMTPSIGVYFIENGEKDIPHIQNCAYLAKSLVKNEKEQLYAVYSSDLERQLTKKKEMEDNLTRALNCEALEVYYQPQYTTDNKEIYGAEALLRWQDRDGGFISPEIFISLAEEKGIIKDIDKYVFRKACMFQKKLSSQNEKPIFISVNISQTSLYNESFIDEYMKILNETGADIDNIQLEITETSIFENRNEFIEIIKKLHSAGFKIMMDDFGTGYSSLMTLVHIPIDYLKLDKTFIDEFELSKGKAIINCIIDMAKRLNITIIAEGIETIEQFDYVKNEGCDIVQGYYFSKAVKQSEFEKLL